MSSTEWVSAAPARRRASSSRTDTWRSTGASSIFRARGCTWAGRWGLTSRGAGTEYAKIVTEEIRGREVPGWLEVDREQLTGRVAAEPGPGDIDPHFNPSAIVEYYSR